MKPLTGALAISGLHKAFGRKVAVDHIDLTVPEGSFFGLVGPNGAGKTTTLSMAVGLLRPDAGTTQIFGPGVKGGGLRAVAMFCLTVCWIPLFPQWIVPAVMLLTDNVAPAWFLALHVPRSQAWPIIAGMITLGLALMVTGFVLLRRAPKPT